MGIESKHPLYSDHIKDWKLMRDCFRGERHVKEQGFEYLPPTVGMVQDGAKASINSDGFVAYDNYRRRARFPDMVKDAVLAALGVMHSKPPQIELPAAMEPLREKATQRNESLEVFLQRINKEQLLLGRLGLMGDVVDVGERAGSPFLALYNGEDVINWDAGQLSRDPDDELGGEAVEVTEPENLNLVVLDETGWERKKDFDWQEVSKYRVLVLGDAEENEPQGEGTYRVGLFRNAQSAFSMAGTIEPSFGAAGPSREIPFVFANSSDIASDPDDPPLLGLANLCMAIYRGEADYRQALFALGQDTLVVIGVSDEERKYRLGAGASITIPNPEGDAKFIGVESSGIPEMRSALENDYKRADQKAGQILESSSAGGDAESGEALKVRVFARTATLRQIAITGAFALESLLKIQARWMGVDDSAVKVVPNLDFVDDEMTGKDLVELVSAKTMGAPISHETIHLRMEQRGMTEKTFEEELAAIESEAGLELGMGSSDEDGPEDDADEPAGSGGGGR